MRGELIRYKNSDYLRQLESHYNKTSSMEIYGVSRKEHPHTLFLKWLFVDFENSKESIKFLLEILVRSKMFNFENVFKGETSIYYSIIIGDYKITNVDITIPNIENNRVDLFISLKINNKKVNIILENKVASKEHNDQTTRYHEAFESERGDAHNFYIYLTPLTTIELEKLDAPECSNKEYIQINYQLILDCILQPILTTTINNSSKNIIKDYILALGYVKSNTNNINIMAISKEETKLLNLFWEENKEIIQKAITVTSTNPNASNEDKEMTIRLNEAIEGIKVGKYVRNGFKKIKDNLNDEEINNLQDEQYSKDVFGINLAFLVKVKTNDKFDTVRYWAEEITIGDVVYRVCSQWYEINRGNVSTWLETFESN